MKQLVRCPYCGLTQEMPEGVMQCRKCGGDLNANVQTSSPVFICYSRKDKAFTDRLTADLKAQGVNTWRDVDNIPLQSQTNRNQWRLAVEDALKRCSTMLVILSPDALESDEVQAEWNEFASSKRPIFPVISEPCSVPFYLKIYQIWDMTKEYKEQLPLLAGVLAPKKQYLPPREVPKSPAPRKLNPLWIALIAAVVLIAAGVIVYSLINKTPQTPVTTGNTVNPEQYPLPSELEQPTQAISNNPLPTEPLSGSSDLGVLGKELWRVNVGGEIVHAPTIGPEREIYVVTHNGLLLALNADGSKRWQAIIGSSSSFDIAKRVVIGKDGMVALTNDGHLLTFDSEGNPKLNLGKSGGLTAPPTFGEDGTIYVMSNESTLWAISLEGKDLWNTKLCSIYGGGTWPGAVVSFGDIVLAVCKGDTIYELLADSGTIAYTYQTNDKMESTPAVGQDMTVYFVSDGGWVFAMPKLDKPLWTVSVAGGANMIQMVDAPVVAGPDGLIYVTPRHGTIYALKPEDGSIVWSAKIGGQGVGINPVAVTRNGHVYAKNLIGELFWIDPGGNIKLKLSPADEAHKFAPPAVGPNGELYLGVGTELVAFQPPAN